MTADLPANSGWAARSWANRASVSSMTFCASAVLPKIFPSVSVVSCQEMLKFSPGCATVGAICDSVAYCSGVRPA